MEMHQLRYFAKVADLGNVTRAAEACHVSQPSLKPSRTIALAWNRMRYQPQLFKRFVAFLAEHSR